MAEFSYDDVTPLPISEENPQLCQILYKEEYKTTMGLLRALLAKKEYSERALALTERVIELIAAHYTVWQYRYHIVLNINRSILEELDWCEEIALENLKNYQIWNYRQLLIEHLLSQGCEEDRKRFSYRREYPLMQAMFDEDEKNYHVWSYRKWFVKKFGLLESPEELAFVDGLIAADIRNNSAWNHRFFISFGSFQSGAADPLITEREISYARMKIALSPQNPSSWNYLLGIYDFIKKDIDDLFEFASEYASYRVEDASVEPMIESVLALEVLARIHERKNPQEAARIYDLLGTKYDKIRVRYWAFEKQKLHV
ncbi:hypothetical protein BABINDRAFT_164359 [Babjeviella inositovora NRRL Y-12698]|uniref:Protein farnesyltransferase/geranylgeranyltransferase type-1 subunit alpha n=1 Tax=Babjeviella inositovora NRRL Y-12698 TaxID=984486 RepID=A0A1E3QY90_9ASCO|nr:uncharacterized protein BABINDRAFT_164359 [Babjeviella inositovora NRRL Y-12698]ODQ82588.1 hypothetical protein BABINDRAFT_164359 [Babjeviella inositovora NRRL Y-12698]